jgi:uncharacterized protein with PIN domain
MPRGSYRLRQRRCPSCGSVRVAGEFRRALGQLSVPGGQQLHQCPQCDHIAPLVDFLVIGVSPNGQEGVPLLPRPRNQARYRRCTQCQVALRAAEFPRVSSVTPRPGHLQWRRCPRCGCIGLLGDFPLAGPPRAEQGEAPADA